MSEYPKVYRDGRLVSKYAAGPRHKSDAAPFVQSDYLPDLRHPRTGKIMDSKSAFRAVTKAHGMVEVGNEVQRDTRSLDLPSAHADISRAIQELGG